MISVVGDKLNDLRIYVENLLETERQASGALEGVAKIMYGSQFSISDIDLPAIWIVPSAYSPNEQAGINITEHRIPWRYYCVISNEQDLKQGLIDAEYLAHALREVLRREAQPAGVDDSRTSSVNPALPITENVFVFGASIDVEYIFLIND